MLQCRQSATLLFFCPKWSDEKHLYSCWDFEGQTYTFFDIVRPKKNRAGLLLSLKMHWMTQGLLTLWSLWANFVQKF